jgi:DNA-binding transcriptional LysR family regulator
MTVSEPSWELYRTFLEVFRDGSLSGAARRLGLTQPTAGRHIDALEATLGLTLFTRSQRGLLPTPAAVELLPHVEAMASAQAAFLRVASGESQEERGAVRLTASVVMGCEVLPAILAPFCANHPGIVPELALSNRVEDLLRRDADIAVRMVRPKQDALVARRIGEVGIGLYAHKDYAARFGLPATVEELQRHRFIGFDRDETSFRSVGDAPKWLERGHFGFRTDNDIAQMAALRAGIGIGGCQKPIAARDPALLPVLAEQISLKLEVWVVMHESLRATRRVRMLFDHLCEGLAEFVRGR